METIFLNWWKKATESKRAKQAKHLKEEAEMVFQVREHNNELWITYDNNLLCPASLFNGETLDIVHKLREYYIKEKLYQLSK